MIIWAVHVCKTIVFGQWNRIYLASSHWFRPVFTSCLTSHWFLHIHSPVWTVWTVRHGLFRGLFHPVSPAETIRTKIHGETGKLAVRHELYRRRDMMLLDDAHRWDVVRHLVYMVFTSCLTSKWFLHIHTNLTVRHRLVDTHTGHMACLTGHTWELSSNWAMSHR